MNDTLYNFGCDLMKLQAAAIPPTRCKDIKVLPAARYKEIVKELDALRLGFFGATSELERALRHLDILYSDLNFNELNMKDLSVKLFEMQGVLFTLQSVTTVTKERYDRLLEAQVVKQEAGVES